MYPLPLFIREVSRKYPPYWIVGTVIRMIPDINLASRVISSLCGQDWRRIGDTSLLDENWSALVAESHDYRDFDLPTVQQPKVSLQHLVVESPWTQISPERVGEGLGEAPRRLPLPSSTAGQLAELLRTSEHQPAI